MTVNSRKYGKNFGFGFLKSKRIHSLQIRIENTVYVSFLIYYVPSKKTGESKHVFSFLGLKGTGSTDEYFI